MPPTFPYRVLGAPDAEVRAETVGPTLTLYATDDEPTALCAIVAALPEEPDRVAVVSAPAVTGRPDLFEVLPDLVAEHLGGVAAGVRLVPVGRYAPAVRAEMVGPALAGQIGQPVVLPPEAVRDIRQVPPVWLVCAPGGPVGTEPFRLSGVAAVTGPTAELPVVTRRAPKTSPGSSSPGSVQPAAAALPERGEGPVPASGVRTPAGLSFVDGPAAVGAFPALGGTVIEIAFGAKGFTAGGRVMLPRALAAAIAQAGLAPPYIVVSGGGLGRGPKPDLYLGSLADALAAPVVAADAPVSMFATGLLTTSGTFWRWCPRDAPERGSPIERLGPVLPTNWSGGVIDHADRGAQ
jgi:hypothetical protein